MKRQLWISLILCSLFFGCTSNNQKQTTERVDDSTSVPDAIVNTDSVTIVKPTPVKAETDVIKINKTVLSILKAKNYTHLANYIHPKVGVRFSPYAYIDTAAHVKLSKNDFLKLLKNKKSVFWGLYDGSGDSINLNIQNYFEKFVYDADFLNAPKQQKNKIIGKGNDINNIRSVYPTADFIESHFPYFDQKYEGLDWKSLRLVYKKYGDKYYLIAIIHDQWTS